MPDSLRPSTAADLLEVGIVRQQVEHARERGADTAAVLAGLGIDPDDLQVEGGYLDRALFYRLQGALADALGDPLFGLSVARVISSRGYGLLGLLFERAPTPKDALHRLATLLPSFVGGSAMKLVEGDGTLDVQFVLDRDVAATTHQRQELVGGLRVSTERLSGREVRPLAVGLRQTDGDPAALRAFFGVDVRLGAPVDHLMLPLGPLEVPSTTADPIVLAHLLDAVDVELGRRRAWVGRHQAVLRLEGCQVDLVTGRVVRGAETLWLTSKERELLEFFAARPNEIVTRDQVERDVWRLERSVLTFAPAVAIRRLRQKIEPKGSRPVNLQTVFGDGWRLRVQAA